MEGQKRESLFSSLSLGRSAKATPQRSSENLAAHPLLASSSTTTSPTTATHGQDASDTAITGMTGSNVGNESYQNLPYKPRQRHGGGQGSGSSFTGLANGASPSTSPVTTTTLGATTSSPSVTITTPSSSSIASTSGNVTARLQLQSLKAAGQRMGLANGSYGMGILDSIFEKGAGATGVISEDWSDVLRVLMTGKATLLLPTTPSSSLPITPTTLRDHIAFVAPALSQVAGPVVVVTLSGLVGTLTGETLVLESCTPINGPLLNALREPVTRASALSSLKPIFSSPPLTANPAFPTFTLGTGSSLPFPALAKQSVASGSSRGRAGSSASSISGLPIVNPVAGSASRLNPFASLFGSSANSASKLSATSTPLDASPEVKDGTVSPTPSSPRPSIDSLSIVEPSDSEAVSVPAHTVSRVIKATEAHKALTKALRGYIRDTLQGIPEKVVERVYKFLLGPVLPLPGQAQGDLAKALAGGSPDKPLDFADPEEVSAVLQGLVEEVYDELVASYKADNPILTPPVHNEMGILRRKGSGSGRKNAAEYPDETEAQKKARTENEKRAAEEKVERDAAEGTDRIETLICLMLYNQIFSPDASDDSRHDEALSSRIAALNMLDLSLDHLGVRTREDDPAAPDPKKAKRDAKVAAGLDDVVIQVGLELQKLNSPSCQSPRDKADVLVHAHKLVVDSLARLPNIRLRPEGEEYRPTVEPSSPALTPESDPTISVPPPLPARPASLASPDKRPAELLPASTTDGHDPLADSTPRSLEPIADRSVSEMSLPDAEGLEDAMASSVLTIGPDRTSIQSEADDTDDSDSDVPAEGATSGADLLLPLIIFSVVKSNPSHLVSQLMYLRRYRSAICLTGEVSYAIVNLTAVVEFLEHVDLAELGLGKDSGKVISVDDLSPIGLTYLDESNADTASIASASSRLRGRVNQVGELAGSAAGSANKVLTGVVDSSWTALRGLINTNAANMVGESPEEPVAELLSATSATSSRPGIPPRRASTFSLASVTASVANIAAAAASGRDRSKSAASATESSWGGNREMVDVSSRPASIREVGETAYSDDDEEESEDEGSERSEDDAERGHMRRSSDARSIRSVSSMMSKDGRKDEAPKTERVSLSNRFASMNVLGRLASGAAPGEKASGTASPVDGSPSKQSPSSFLANLTTTRSSSGHRNSLLGQVQPDLFGPAPTGVISPERGASPVGSFASLPITRLSSNLPDANEPPLERFMTCEVGDIKLSEIGLLLRDYRRLASMLAAKDNSS